MNFMPWRRRASPSLIAPLPPPTSNHGSIGIWFPVKNGENEFEIVMSSHDTHRRSPTSLSFRKVVELIVEASTGIWLSANP